MLNLNKLLIKNSHHDNAFRFHSPLIWLAPTLVQSLRDTSDRDRGTFQHNPALVKVKQGVLYVSIDNDLKMEMGTVGITGFTNVADYRSPAYLLPEAHVDP